MAFDVKTANNAREHNDANVLTLGAGYLDEAQAAMLMSFCRSIARLTATAVAWRIDTLDPCERLPRGHRRCRRHS